MGMKIAAGICLALAVPFALIYYFSAVSTNTAEVRGQAGQKERVVADEDYRVANHRYFYDLCADIQARQQNIEVLEDGGYKQEAAANRMQLNEMASEYNAASADQQRANFKEDELPYRIDPEKEVESCG